MEKFESLSIEKRNKIIEAALFVFGSKGYKKASVGDIAAAAGVSKPSLFHYFGTKKRFYFYIADTCGNFIISKIKEALDMGITDFFEKIIISSKIKMDSVEIYPSILLFFENMYFEQDEEVHGDIQKYLKKMGEYRARIMEQNVDTYKFKNGIEPGLVMKALSWMSIGYANILKNNRNLDLDASIDEFMQCLNLMKNNFYKEEYLA